MAALVSGGSSFSQAVRFVNFVTALLYAVLRKCCPPQSHSLSGSDELTKRSQLYGAEFSHLARIAVTYHSLPPPPPTT